LLGGEDEHTSAFVGGDPGASGTENQGFGGVE
jgi:hypothetical protein